MVLEIHTDYDAAHLEELQRVLSQTVNPEIAKSSKRSCYIAGGLAVVAGVGLMVAMHKVMAMAMVIVGLGLFCLERGVNYFKHAGKSVRRRMNPAFTGNDYILDELGIRVENVTGVLEYNYEDCDRLLETEKNVYIILNDGQGLILDKNNLQGGSVEQLHTWLEENCKKQLEFVELKGK